MWRKISQTPLKWKVLLGGQAAVTAVLITRRLDPQVFDPLFEKRVLVVTKSDNVSKDSDSIRSLIKSYEVTVKKAGE